VILFLPSMVVADERDISGTYKLISSTRKILDTGEVVDAFGKKPSGLIAYGKDAHFLVLITYDGRVKPESIEKMTDQQRAELHRKMLAYGGTYTWLPARKKLCRASRSASRRAESGALGD
jgi:hypothetical protein